MIISIKLPPGIRSVGTHLDRKGRWLDCNFIRWVEGVMQPVGKWARVTDSVADGRINELFAHRDNVPRDYLVIGTNTKCYVIIDNILTDITPTGFNPGNEKTIEGDGFGAALYGAGTYGTPRTTTGVFHADVWSFDHWGKLLVGCAMTDGRLWLWDPGDAVTSPDAEMSEVPNAPQNNRAVLVTDERHMMAIAADGDPKTVAWSAREDYTTWTPMTTNSAGDLLLETSGTLLAGFKVQSEILVLSDVDAFLVTYVGAPLFYGQEQVGHDCGVVGPHAAVTVNDFVVWMGRSGFYIFRGQVDMLDCDVWDFVYRTLNERQYYLVTCGHNAEFSEVWWFLPVEDDVTCTRYVVWNYRENWWSVGYLERSAWYSSGIFNRPLAAGEDGYVYEHEVAIDGANAEARDMPYIESSPYEIGDGGDVMFVTELIPDQDAFITNAIQFRLKSRFAPRLQEYEFGPYVPDSTGYIPVRLTGREVKIRVEVYNDHTDWRLGTLRADARRGGRK